MIAGFGFIVNKGPTWLMGLVNYHLFQIFNAFALLGICYSTKMFQRDHQNWALRLSAL